MFPRIFLTLALVATPVAAQQEWIGGRDFLTEHEIDQIRLAQEPNVRIETYLHFATLRLALIDQIFEKDEPGRGGKIHQNLDEFGRILEAIDMVIDDALLRDADLEEAMTLVREQEPQFLARLQELQDAEPDDLWRYEFVLENAIEIAADSLELAGVDPNERKRELIDSDDAEKAAREDTMTAARRKEVQEANEAAAEQAEGIESKRPSLLKEGETLEGLSSPPKKKKKK